MIKTVVLPDAKPAKKVPGTKGPPPDRKVVGEARWKYAAEAEDMMGLLRDLAAGNRVERGAIRLVRSQIGGKLSSYRSQDVAKGLYREDMFVGWEEVVAALVECGLACHFCGVGMKVLYASCRDPLQWSLDRIDNALGHNRGNVYPVCLACNLRRREIAHDRFFFTKQVVWRKVDHEEAESGATEHECAPMETEKMCADKVK